MALPVMLLFFACVVGVRAAAAEPVPEKECTVSSGRVQETALPEEVGLDSVALARAVDFAAQRNRATVQIFRHNCLVATAPDNEQRADTAWNLFSVAKSVVSMATGVAYDEGKLGLDDAIGRYLPVGVGDEAHRGLTIRQLLTETSGLRSATVSEGVTGLTQLDPDVVRQALATPFAYRPGTVYEYNQRAVDLLSYVVERAVGQPFQSYVQEKLFDPLGILKTDFYWARDRSGNTYGYSYLYMPPNDLSKLGLLLSMKGSWNGTRLLSENYLRQALTPSEKNPCYGFLLWLNPPSCDDPVPSGAPEDTFAMSGFGLQNAFVVPSLDMVITWTGVLGNYSNYGVLGVIQNSSELTHNFFRDLLAAVRDVEVADPGPYVELPIRSLDPGQYTDLDITLGILGIGPSAYPGCTVLDCNGQFLVPPLSDLPPGCVLIGCFGTAPGTPRIS